MPPKFKGPKLPKIPICTTPEPAPVVPVDLDKHTTITIENETFDIEADDLEVICELGKFSFIISWVNFVLIKDKPGHSY